MKKILCSIIFILLGISLTSCFRFVQGYDLNEIIQTLTIKEDEQEVEENFLVPKYITYEKRNFEIQWFSASDLVGFKKYTNDCLVQISFENALIKKTEISLVASIKQGRTSATKTFKVYAINRNINEEESDPNALISFKEKTFSNRLDQDGPMTDYAFPSIGQPRLLVIPVNLDNSKKTQKNLDDIRTAFTGSSEETGWESVQSYYQKSSYNKLNMEVTVLNEWFTPKHSMKYYNSYSKNGDDGSTLILREALSHYDTTLNYQNYDYNEDGFIDSVWLIYNCSVDFYDDTLFWAFTSWNYDETKYDGVEAYAYAWAGIDFMHQTKLQAGYYDPTDITVDAHTYIHETGHLLGLDDYYDYDEQQGSKKLGFLGCDMMDYNIGDHSPISKLLLGWVSPIVVTGKGTDSIELSSFTTTGQFLIIADHTLNSIYDTYYTIEFYTNDGLNAHDKPYDSNQMDYGIRVMLIRAEKNLVHGEVVVNSGDYQTGFKYDNSDEALLFAEGIYDGEPSTFNDYSLDAYCLFQYPESLTSPSLPFDLSVISMTKEKATITITMK